MPDDFTEHVHGCPACGYNLLGIPGDPLRCPECGTVTARADLWAPFVNTSRALSTLLWLAVASLAAAVLVVLLALYMALAGSLSASTDKAIAAIIAVVAALAWAVLARAFGRRCEPGSRWALLLLQLYFRYVTFFIGLCLAAGAWMFVLHTIAAWLPRRSRSLEDWTVIVSFGLALLLLTHGPIATLAARWLHGPLVPAARLLAIRRVREARARK